MTTPVARRSDPDTSWAAADSVDLLKISDVQWGILKLLREYGPLPDDRIWDGLEYLGLQDLTSPSGARTRRAELVRKRLVEDSGERVRGPTNRKMIVWKAT